MRSRVRRFALGLAVITVVGSLWLPSPLSVSATSLTVTNCSDTGVSGDGSLRGEIAAAANGDTLSFAVDCPVASPITLTGSTLTIGKNLTIDGTGHSIAIDGANAVTVVTVSSGVTATINGVTIQHGNTGSAGGGIFNNGTLNLTNCAISGNTANGTGVAGGAIFNNGTLTVTDSTLANNSVSGASANGGAIYNAFSFSATVTVLRTDFSNNTAGAGGQGGAIFALSRGTETITNSTFENNSATGGGAIFTGNTLSVTGSTFTSNSATNGDGGAIEVNGGTTTVTGSTFTSNSANSAGTGGALFANGGTTTVTNSAFTGNIAPNGGAIGGFAALTVTGSALTGNIANNGDGGGIYVQGAAPLTLTNSTVANNSAFFDGGGLFTFITGNAAVTLVNSTITGNQVTRNGGGILNINSGASFTATNTLIAGNTVGANGQGPDMKGAFTSASHTLLGNASNATGITNGTNGNIVGQPAFIGSLGAYGGATQTIPLLPGSPAIDAGDDTTCAAALPAGAGGIDQRGITRPQGAHCDIGAFESQGFALSKTSGDNQSTPTNRAFPGPLVVTVSSSHGEPVNGGQVTFTGPISGASIATNPTVATISSGMASAPVTANGTPGSYTVTASATSTAGSHAVHANAGAGMGGVTFTLTNTQALAITSAASATFTVGTMGSFTVTTTGSPTPSLTEMGMLPMGVTFTDTMNGTAMLAGTPMAGTGGVYPLTLTAHNGVSTDATQMFTLTVNEAPAITSANRATFTVGAMGSFTVTTSGVPAVTTIGEMGTLPMGVTFTDNMNGTATLAGTPAAGGSYPLAFTASNGVGTPATQMFTLTVNEAPAITSATGTTFALNTMSSFTVTTTGFPKPTLSEMGALPIGVMFIDNGNGTATIAGAPTNGGAFPLTLTASNGVLPNARQMFTLTVNQAPAITSGTSATFTVGTMGNFTVTTTGFPAPTLTEMGALPTGVTFTDTMNGTATLAGTPMAGTGGMYTLTLTASNGVTPNATQTFTLTVSNATPMVNVTSSSAMNTSVFGASVTFAATVTGVNGVAPTGTVTFTNGMTPLGMPAPLMPVVGMPNVASATLTTSGLPVGSDTITATYSGDPTYATATGSVTQIVGKATPAVSVASSSTMNTSVVGTSVTFTATVAGIDGVAPTGTVTFISSDGTPLPAAMQTTTGTNLIATVSTSGLKVGMDTLSATYSGDTTYTTATGSVTQVVQAAQVTRLTATAPPSSVCANSGGATMPVLLAGATCALTVVGSYNNGTMGSVSPLVFAVTRGANVVQVDGTGKVTGIAAGTAVITVSGPNGTSTTIAVTVTGATGAGLTNPQPMPHAAAVVTAAAMPLPQPGSHPAGGSGASESGTQPNAMGSEAPMATPLPQPERHP